FSGAARALYAPGRSYRRYAHDRTATRRVREPRRLLRQSDRHPGKSQRRPDLHDFPAPGATDSPRRLRTPGLSAAIDRQAFAARARSEPPATFPGGVRVAENAWSNGPLADGPGPRRPRCADAVGRLDRRAVRVGPAGGAV